MLILLSRGIQIASSFFVVVIVARYLSVDQYGEYSFIIALVSSIMAIVYFGIQQVMIREIANNKEAAGETLGVAVQLRAILSIVAVSVLAVLMYLMKLKGILLAAGIIAIASEFFLAFSMLSKAVFQAYEKMIYEPVISLLYSVVLTAGIAAVIYLDLGFLWLFVAVASANLSQLLLSSNILSRNFVRPVFTAERSLFRKFLKDSVVIGVGIFFYQNLFRINVLMLKWFGNINDVSYFQAPHSLIMQLQVVPMSVAMAVFPVFSRLLHTEKEKLPLIYEKIFRFMLIGSVFCALSLALFSHEIVDLVFGSKFSHSAAALSVVAWAIIPLTMDMLLNVVLITMHKQKYSVIYAGMTLLLNTLFSVMFVPSHGYMAAAYISLFSYSLLFACSLYYVGRNGLFIPLGRNAVKLLVVVLMSGGAMLLLKAISWPLAGLAGTVVFFGLILFGRLVTVDEVRLIKGMIRSIPNANRRPE
jgi:O-antigen/teichoic acid export membrane protein